MTQKTVRQARGTTTSLWGRFLAESDHAGSVEAEVESNVPSRAKHKKDRVALRVVRARYRLARLREGSLLTPSAGCADM